MAEFPNNNFRHETPAQHGARVSMCVNGIASHPSANVPEALADGIIAHKAAWESLENKFSEEFGDQMGATALVQKLLGELSAQIRSARYMVHSVTGAEPEGVRKVVFEEFGVVGKIPKRRLELIALGKKMVDTNARYVAESSPFALPEDRLAEMAVKTAEAEDAIKEQDIAKAEKHRVADMRREERIRGDKLLAGIFNWLCAFWSPEDHRLLEFGFVSKSQIQTKKKSVKKPHESPR